MEAGKRNRVRQRIRETDRHGREGVREIDIGSKTKSERERVGFG